MAKSWSAHLVPAEEKRIEPPFIAPASQKTGKIKKTWDILFLEYSKIFRVNLLVGAAFLPFAIYLFSIFLRVTELQSSLDYALNTGIGYPFISVDNASKIADFVGAVRGEAVFVFLLALIPGPLFAGVFDVTKLLMWQNSEFKVFSTFIKAVKKNWWKYTALYSVFCAGAFGASVLALGQYQAYLTGGASVGGYVGLGFALLSLLTYFVFMMYAFSMIPVYDDLKFKDVLKNSALYTFGIYPVNILFSVISFAPVLLVLTKDASIMIITVLIVFFLLMTIGALVWTSLCQHGFEHFLNKIYELYIAEKVKLRAEKNAGKNRRGGEGTEANHTDKNKKKTVNVYKNPKKKKAENKVDNKNNNKTDGNNKTDNNNRTNNNKNDNKTNKINDKSDDKSNKTDSKTNYKVNKSDNNANK
jgi:hypothetical protein